MAYLLVVKGMNSRENIPLEKDQVVLGRNASCDIVFPANDFAVSREHARIVRTAGQYYLEDCGSRNGTYLNNQQVTARMPLHENDRIRICDVLYSFHDEVEPAGVGSLGEPALGSPTPPGVPPLPTQELPESFGDEAAPFSGFEASISHKSELYLQESTDRLREKLRAIVEISNKLTKTLELSALLPKIMETLFDLFKQADRGFIILREETAEGDKPRERLVPKVVKARRGLDETAQSYSRAIVRECLKTVQAFLSEDASADKRFNMSQSIADFRIRSVMCAPLWTQDDKAVGVIQLDTQDRTKRFTQEDLNLLMLVANNASISLENARLHEASLARERLRRDLELAQQVQLSFLPQRLPALPGYEFDARYEPAQEVGGDYYDFIPLNHPKGSLAVLLGDVAGKGIPAALLMAKLASDARASFLSESQAGAAVSVLNEFIYQSTSQMDRFVTLAAAVLDPTTHQVTFANAGHPTPLIYRKTTQKLEPMMPREGTGLPLGVMEGLTYPTHQVVLEPGDTVLLFSDGITEAMDKSNNLIDLKAIESALAGGPLPPQALGERIVQNVKRFAQGQPQHDDMTLICFGRSA
jgi:serine phosphatase RsbU (regulator of sigma subunit)/pSer/pThr/pTyr-binding forkhead associated (FHA) protein